MGWLLINNRIPYLFARSTHRECAAFNMHHSELDTLHGEGGLWIGYCRTVLNITFATNGQAKKKQQQMYGKDYSFHLS
jgi:hypothetical protein